MSFDGIAPSIKFAITVASGSMLVGMESTWRFLGEVSELLPSGESFVQWSGGILSLVTAFIMVGRYLADRSKAKRDDKYRERLRALEEREELLALEYRAGRHVGHGILSKKPTE